VQFGLQFEQMAEGQDNVSPATTAETPKPATEPKKRVPAPRPQASVPAVPSVPTPANPEPKEPPKAAGGAEVVRLDRFRKK
jgi:hypothetical protein